MASVASSSTPITTPKVSKDGTCGGSKGTTCLGSTYGNCCRFVQILDVFYLTTNFPLVNLDGAVRQLPIVEQDATRCLGHALGRDLFQQHHRHVGRALLPLGLPPQLLLRPLRLL
jgi:hypothetical protein